MRNRIFWFLLLNLFMVFYCTKKDKPEQDVLIPPETATVDIETPEPRWEKTYRIATADTSMLTRIMAESMARRLSRPGIRILSGDSEASEAADYTIYPKAAQHGSRVTLSYRLNDNRQEMISRDTVSLNEEMMLTAIETLSIQAVSSTGDTTVLSMPEHSTSSDAVNDFFEAESFRLQGTPGSLNQAVRLYKAALRSDSLLTDAWIGLAECYLYLIEQGYERNPVWLSLAQHTGFKLKQLCVSCGYGETVAGRIALLRGDFTGAETEFRQAIEKNPNILQAWRGLGQIYGRYGLYKAALQMYDYALNIDPVDLSAGVSKAMILGGSGDYQGAVILLQALIKAHPGEFYLHSILALQLYYQNEFQAALGAVRTGLADTGYKPLSHAILAMILVKLDDRDQALGELELEVKSYAEGNGALATAVAAVYSLLGRPGESIQWLRSAVDWGYLEYPWLINDPNFSNLAKDVRYQAVCDSLKGLYDQRQQAYLESRHLVSAKD